MSVVLRMRQEIKFWKKYLLDLYLLAQISSFSRYVTSDTNFS
jgi:hypothetical protein